ncbi:MAG: XrtA system polysaccharide chain length determinant [Gammaproteobacteria bacterium]
MQQELTEVYFYIKGTLKYKRVALLFALLVCVCGWAYVFTMPDKFESKAKVHIDSSTIIRPLLRGMVIDPDVTYLIRLIQQLMFTRPNLEKIVELSRLNAEKENSVITEEFIDGLKKDITISGAGGASSRDIFDIGYSATDPEVARSVVQAVLTVFSEQTQGKAMADASDAQRFIEQQIREYEIRLQEAEKSREDFKRNNMDLLGETGQFSQLGALKEQLSQAHVALEQANARKQTLAEQVKGVQESEDDDWGLSSLGGNVSEEDARISSLKDKKMELLIKYTEKHPEVLAIDRLIESLKEQADADKKSDETESVGDLISPEKMVNPYVQSLKIAFDNAAAEVAANEALVNSINGRISEIEKGLSERLAIETEMKSLNRDYETVSKKYSELLERREQAHITERVDDQTSRLKFKIADPPTRPTYPSFPNRPLYYSLIMLGGVLSGFGLAFLFYFIRPVFMSVKQVRTVTGLPSLGSISMTGEGVSTNKHFDWLLLLTVGALLSGYVSIMLFDSLK